MSERKDMVAVLVDHSDTQRKARVAAGSYARGGPVYLEPEVELEDEVVIDGRVWKRTRYAPQATGRTKARGMSRRSTSR